MAKKSKKKNDNMSLIFNVIVIALGVLALCTIFMPVFNIDNILGGVLDYSIKGSDVISGAFASELSSEMTAGAAKMYTLRTLDDMSFVANVFAYGYILTLVLSCAGIVFAVLNILKLKFKMVNTIIGAVWALLVVVTFIFAIVLSSKYASINTLGNTVTSKAVMAVGTYFLIAVLGGGLLQFYSATKK
ncbi:MAG: hypothetical protein E7345_03675 [Clostridiales bacterium]|nr:hypothetical protein [Clostridiales bacterium]